MLSAVLLAVVAALWAGRGVRQADHRWLGAAQGPVVTVRAAPTPVEPLVAGPPARLLDVRHAVATRLPLAVGIVVGIVVGVTVALSVAVDALVIRLVLAPR